jgi:hypothetical protein
MGLLDKLISIQKRPYELLSADFKNPEDLYVCVWTDSYVQHGGAKLSLVELGFFSTDNGYDEEDIIEIGNLASGEEKIIEVDHWIVRIK